MKSIKYVVGFAFSKDRNDIVLIKKNKPEWQAGMVNGIGGKIEDTDDRPVDAMRREFKEETGVDTLANKWKHYATLKVGDAVEVYCFVYFDNEIYNCRTIEKEEVFIIATDTALGEFRYKFVPNTKVLVELALENKFNHSLISIS